MSETTKTAAADSAEPIAVGLAEMKVTNHPHSCLTASLVGSGVVIAIYDPEVRVGGLVHCMLPRFEIDEQAAMENPARFVDSAIPKLYKRCYKLGAVKERVLCFVAGAAEILEGAEEFSLGRENLEAALEVLEKNNAQVTAQWTGGTQSREVRLYTADGRLVLDSLEGEVTYP